MQIFDIPAIITVTATVRVEANTIEDAMEAVNNLAYTSITIGDIDDNLQSIEVILEEEDEDGDAGVDELDEDGFEEADDDEDYDEDED